MGFETMRQAAAPPVGEVDWTATALDGASVRVRRVRVRAHSWFDARRFAMAEMGCGPAQLVVVQDPTDVKPERQDKGKSKSKSKGRRQRGKEKKR